MTTKEMLQDVNDEREKEGLHQIPEINSASGASTGTLARKDNSISSVPDFFKKLCFFPIETVVLTIFLAFMQPITYRMKLTYHAEASLRFNRKQFALLLTLFVFGCGCVTGYLFYHYDNTSLTTGYSTEERIEKNQQMHALILEETDKETANPSVAIIESAYKQFLGYQKGPDGLPEVDPEQAEVVRKIYRLFMAGKTMGYICNKFPNQIA